MKKFISGKYVNQGHYSSFVPGYINNEWDLDDIETINLLGQAERAIGKLDMFSGFIPNIELFIRMHVVKEATQSAKIEGTQTNFEDAFKDRDDIPKAKRDDWDEVQNYIKALGEAMDLLPALPVSGRMIKLIHKTLLSGVRGEHKSPGEFRSSQNWIGGATINDAVFVPPAHTLVPELMGDLEKFMHNDGLRLPDLVKIAIIHYQFETIHPFLDGNGRIGRLLIPLYLVEKGLLSKPTLYISDFFERHRKLYYDNLMQARLNNNIGQWIKFFLVGVTEIATNGAQTFEKVLNFQKETEQKIGTLRSRAHNATIVVNSLYNNPLTNPAKVAKITGLSYASTYSLVNNLVRLGILHEMTGGKRGKQYVFVDYLDIFSR